jgi:large subunit ribosomal protein L29
MARKIEELRQKTVDQLNERLLELKKEQFNLRFQKASGQLEDTSSFGKVKTEIAQIKTLLNEQRAQAAQERS